MHLIITNLVMDVRMIIHFEHLMFPSLLIFNFTMMMMMMMIVITINHRHHYYVISVMIIIIIITIIINYVLNRHH